MLLGTIAGPGAITGGTPACSSAYADPAAVGRKAQSRGCRAAGLFRYASVILRTGGHLDLRDHVLQVCNFVCRIGTLSGTINWTKRPKNQPYSDNGIAAVCRWNWDICILPRSGHGRSGKRAD